MIEALVSAAMVAIGIASAVGATGSLARGQVRLQGKERMQRLAIAKYDELRATGPSNSAGSGDFGEWNESRYEWTADIQTTATTGLDSLRVTVTSQVGEQAAVQGLFFTPPEPAAGAQP